MLAAPIGIRFQSGATTIRTRDKDRSVAAPTRPAAASSCGDNAHRQRKAPQATLRQSRDDLQTTWKNRLEMGPAMNAQQTRRGLDQRPSRRADRQSKTQQIGRGVRVSFA
jgi:hypothetical protein